MLLVLIGGGCFSSYAQTSTTNNNSQEIVIQVENYFANSYYRNGYWDSLENSFTGSPENKSYLSNKLYDFFRPSQRELFAACKAGGDVNLLTKNHEAIYKSKLDSVVAYYSAHEDELIPKIKLPFEFNPPPPPVPQYCENMDMELCNFNNWQLQTGRVNNVPYGFINALNTATFGKGIPGDGGSLHSIVSAAGTDPITGIQVINPGGTCSAVLGDRLGDGYRASKMTRTFQVTADNYFFSYSYAVIMEDPANVHTPGERPYFTVRMFDQGGGQLNCADYEVYAGDGNPAWLSRTSLTGNYDLIAYTDWTNAFIPLQAYIGQNVTIEFSVGDCNLGGHAAYAYVEAKCGGEIAVEDTFICPGAPVEMIAPGGASSYLWNTGATTQSIMASDSGLYTVVMGSTADNSCTTQLSRRMYLKEAPLGDFSTDTVCMNTPTTFTDKSLPATTGLIDWQWDFNNDGTYDGSGQSITNIFTTSGNHTVTLLVEDSNECLHDTSFVVNVLANPVVSFDYNNPCLNDSTFLTNTSSNYNVVQWDLFNDGSLLSNSVNETHLYTSQQNVELKLTSSDGCSDSLVQTILINPLPAADFSSTEVCFPFAIDYTDASTITSGAVVSWVWDFGDAAGTSAIQNPSYAHAAFGDYDVQLIVVSDSSCRDTIVKPISYFEKPVVDFTVNDTCQNEVFTMTNTSVVNSSTFVTWNWDVQNNGVTNYLSEHATHTLANAGIDSIKLIGVTAQGCRDTIVRAVHIDTLPTALFRSLPVCLNETTAFVDLSTGTTVVDWAWDFLNDGSVDATVQNPSNLFATDGLNAVELRVTTDKGCKDSIVLNSLINPLPVADFSSTEVCFPFAIDYTDASTITSGAVVSWVWDFGDAAGTSAIQNPSYAHAAFGDYDVQLIVVSDSSCRDTLVKPISYFEKPVVDFTVNDTCQNEVFTMTNTSVVNSSTFVTWNWDVQNNGVTNYLSEHATHTLADAGIDSIKLIGVTAQGCRDTIVKAVHIDTLPTALFRSLPVCLNETTAFVDLSTGTTVVDWAWDFLNDGSVDATVQNPTNLFAADGLNAVELRVTTDKGCKDSIVLNSLINPLPVADFSSINVCFPSESSFTNATAISSGTIHEYNWRFGDGLGTSSAVDPTYTYSSAGDYDVRLIAISDSLCRDTIVKQVSLYEKPVVDFVVNDTCRNEEFQMTNLSTVATASFATWSWDVLNDGSVEYSTQDATHTLTTAGVDSIRLIGITDEGCRDTIVKGITIFPLPTSFFAFSEVCLNDSTVFTSRTQGIIALREWDFGNDGSVESTAINPKYKFTSPGNQAVELKVTSDKGCLDSLTLNPKVNPLPVSDFDFTVVCHPESTVFTDLSSISEGSIANFEWSFGDLVGTSTQQNPTYTYANFGSRDVKLKITSAKLCVDSITKTVQNFEKPIADFQGTNACVFDASVFTDQSSVGSSAVNQWFWDIDNNTTIDYTSQNATHSYTAAGQFDVRLVVETEQECRDTVIHTIQAYHKPVADFQKEDKCVGDVISFTDLSTSIDGTLNSWNWEFGDLNFSTQQNPTHTYGFEQVYDVKLIVSTTNNCSDEIVYPVSAFPIPRANFSTNLACLNQETVFTNNSSVSSVHTSNSIASALWDFGDGSTSTNLNATHVYAGSGTYTARLDVVTNNTCPHFITRSVVVNPIPEINMVSTLEEGCSEWCVDFTDASSISSGSISSYSWDFENRKASGTTPSNCFVNDTQTPLFFDVTLSATSTAGCSNSRVYSDYVTVFPLSYADFTYFPNLVNDQDPTYQFTNESIGSIWEWDFGDGDSSSIFSPKHRFSEAGTYDVTLFTNNEYNCSDSITKPVRIIPTTGFYAPNAITVDDDGLNDIFYIYGYNITDFKLHVFDRWGLRLFTSLDINVGWDGTYKNKPVQQDVYVYKAYITDIFQKEHVLVGTVTVLR